jgi:hypothetical protein
MPQTVIYVNYFSDPNPARRDEYLYCLSQNQRLDWVDKIYVFLESAQDLDDIKNHHKMEFIYHNSRMEFGDVFLAYNERFDDAKFQAACGITWPTFVRL